MRRCCVRYSALHCEPLLQPRPSLSLREAHPRCQLPRSWRRHFSITAPRHRFDASVRARLAPKAAQGYKTKKGRDFDKAAFEALLQRRHFIWPSFESYGSAKGFFDYGPPLEALENEVLAIWRDHFIHAEQMLALKSSMITPYNVLKASGHVDRFADYMCRDAETDAALRVDHLIREVLESRLGHHNTSIADRADYEHILTTLDDLDIHALERIIRDYDIRNPATNNRVKPPVPINLMFQTQIGSSSDSHGFLRPETAQGQFLAFRKLLKYNNDRMPFASATIGYSFRNEISPRSSLLRVREFLMAEIEHFVDPAAGKTHPKFASVASVELPLLSREAQRSNNPQPQIVAVGDAVRTKLVDNETLAFYLVRIYQFMQRIGIDTAKLRFRQHMGNEMAHYATDCWDCELLTSYGWTECVGCADRSAYDLRVHSEATGESLSVVETLDQPQTVEEYVAVLNMKIAGPRLKGDIPAVQAALANLSESEKQRLGSALATQPTVSFSVPNSSTGTVALDAGLLTFERRTTRASTREYIPNVIEPSFGIGRILYSLLEHSYWTRENDVARAVLSLPASVAPTKVLVAPLRFRNARYDEALARLEARLRGKGVTFRVDTTSATIGKRYAKADEVGTPLVITLDQGSVAPSEDDADDDARQELAGGADKERRGRRSAEPTFTLRDRDSTAQVRGTEDEIIKAVSRIVKGKESWADVAARLPAFASHGADDEGAGEPAIDG